MRLLHAYNTCTFFNVAGESQHSVLLVSVPDFDLTHSCVLVNLNTLECHEMKFATSLKATAQNLALLRQREIEAELEGSLSGSSQAPGLLEEEMSLLHHMDQDDNFED